MSDKAFFHARPSARAALFVVLLVACRVGDAIAQPSGTVSGRVSGAAGEALVGASVSLTGTQRGTIARGDGAYQLTAPAGRYEIRARLIGYTAVVDTVTVTAGQVASKSFTLSRAATSLDAVAIIGTRSGERTVIDAPVPIDVLSAVDIQQSGRTETAQMIQSVAPSFNFPRPSVNDGTDHIRPATLRGLAPDQVLVLVNGKRRHTSALVNVNGSIGRGAAAVDLNALPASMIDRIEILRDGAAAQYGSDAIAGVINIILKSNAPASYMTQIGQSYTTYNRATDAAAQVPQQIGPRNARDGKLFTSALSYGWSFGQTGYLHAGAEVRDRGATNRTLPDTRPQYFANDPRNNNPPQINHRQGDAATHDVGGFLNAGTTLSGGAELYAFGGLTNRRGDAAGFWRRANDDRTLRNIYADGFLPLIQSDIWDGSGAAGIRGTAMGWKYDLSEVYGRNSFAYSVVNSANVSLGPTSPTRFDAGTLRFAQSTTNLDLFRELHGPLARPIRAAIGAEYRADMYGIDAGERASYEDGLQPVLNPDGTIKRDANGNPVRAAAGAQVFPGFRPSDAGDHSRSNVAAYVDLESDVSRQLLVGVAARYEHYSDFGATTTGKVAMRYAASREVALRGAISSGFKAPSLAQEYFSSTATNFIGGLPFDIRTFPVFSPEAKVLGGSPLTPEKSMNYSAGIALEPAKSFATTVDFYWIKIKDRIVLSENFTGTLVQAEFVRQGISNVSGGRFFTNAIDTRSHGVDIVSNYGMTLANGGVLRLTGSYNLNKSKVTHVDTTPTPLRTLSEALFGRVERARIEKGQPSDNVIFSANYNKKALGLTARTQRFGAVTSYGTLLDGSLDQTFSPKWITDVSGSYTLMQRYTLTVGADNVFDVYPDRNNNPGNPSTTNGGNANFGIFPYSGISPFGFNGRFVYTKIALTF